MRIRTELSEMPPAFTVAKEETKAVITFYTDVAEEQREEGKAYTAISWTIERNWSPDIEQRIANNLSKWLAEAQDECYNKAAEIVRAERNALLTDSDKDMAFDRLNIDLPENITAINLLTSFISFIKSLKEIMTGAVAKYRQALRDIPEQEGFPYDVKWPEKK